MRNHYLSDTLPVPILHNLEHVMRSILLWLIGVPLPLILLLALCTHHL